MSYSYPIETLNLNPPRSFVYSSNNDALILDSTSEDTRLRFINSKTLSNLSQSFTLSSSNEIFSIIKNNSKITDYNLDNNNNGLINVYGSLSSSNLIISKNSYKSIILSDYNSNILYKYAGFGFSNDILNYQVPTNSNIHIFSSSNKEWMRIQQNEYGNPQVGIGITNIKSDSNLLIVGGYAKVDGILTVTSNIVTSKISSPTSYIDFSGKTIINSGSVSFDTINVSSIISPSGNVSLNNNNILDVNQLIVRSNITVLSTGLNTYSNLPLNVVFTNTTSGKIDDTIISSNIPRLQQNGLINPTQLPLNSPTSSLLRSFNKLGVGIRNPSQMLHVNGNQCITSGFLGIGTSIPTNLLHIYDDNNFNCSLIIQNVGSTDLVKIYGSNNVPIFNINSTCNIGILNPSPLYTLDVTGTIHSTQGIKTNYIDSDTKNIDFKNNTINNILNATINNVTTNNLIVNSITTNNSSLYINHNNTSSCNINNIYATNINSGLIQSSSISTNNIDINTIQAKTGSLNIVSNSAIEITGYNTGLFTINNSVLGGDNATVARIGLKVSESILAKCYLTASDRRVKKDIKHLSICDNLEKINKISINTFKLIDNNREEDIRGFIAQELEEILPSVVKTSVNAIPTINDYIIPYNSYNIHISKFPKPSEIFVGQYYKFIDNNTEYIRKIIKIQYPYVEFNESLLIDRNNRVFIYGPIVNDFKMINVEGLLPYIIGSIQELTNKVNNISNKIDDMDTE